MIFFDPVIMSVTFLSYDVEFPLEVDDEYWDQGFVQPPETPSRLSYFVCHLRLCEVIASTSEQTNAAAS
jgi:hypothetical protein